MVITARDIKAATAFSGIGLPVTVRKQPCETRCRYETQHAPTASRAIEQYERGDILDMSHRLPMQTYSALLVESKNLQHGKVGGAK